MGVILGVENGCFWVILGPFWPKGPLPSRAFFAQQGPWAHFFSTSENRVLPLLLKGNVPKPRFSLFSVIFRVFWSNLVSFGQITGQPTAFGPFRRSPTSDSIIRREVRPTSHLRASSTDIGLSDSCSSLHLLSSTTAFHPALDGQLAALLQTGLKTLLSKLKIRA